MYGEVQALLVTVQDALVLVKAIVDAKVKVIHDKNASMIVFLVQGYQTPKMIILDFS